MVDKLGRPKHVAIYHGAVLNSIIWKCFAAKKSSWTSSPLSKAIDARYPLSVSRRDVLWERHSPLKLVSAGNSQDGMRCKNNVGRLRDVIELTVFDISNFGKELHNSANR